MTDMIDLVQLSETTNQTLKSVWKSIGISNDEKSKLLLDLQKTVAAVYDSAVEREKARQITLQDSLASLQQEIVTIASTLDETPNIPIIDQKSLLEGQELLQARMNELEQLKASRLEELSNRQQTLQKLCDLLGVDVEESMQEIGAIFSTQRLQEYDQHIQIQQTEKESRLQTIQQAVETIRSLWKELKEAPTSPFEQQVDAYQTETLENEPKQSSLSLRTSTIEELKSLQTQLQDEKSKREMRIQDMGVEITNLWRRLETSQEEQDTFFDQHSGVGKDVLEACETYLTELRQEFTARIEDLVQGAKEKIHELCTELLYSEEQIENEYETYMASIHEKSISNASEAGEYRLARHEEYILFLEQRLQNLTPILKLITKRDTLLVEKEEYERIIADPNRLLSRGGGAARLREEKLERRIKKELPMITRKLRERVKQWETTNETELIIRGEYLLDTLGEEPASSTTSTLGSTRTKKATTTTGVNQAKTTSSNNAITRKPMTGLNRTKISRTLPSTTTTTGNRGIKSSTAHNKSHTLRAKISASTSVTTNSTCAVRAPLIPSKTNSTRNETAKTSSTRNETAKTSSTRNETAKTSSTRNESTCNAPSIPTDENKFNEKSQICKTNTKIPVPSNFRQTNSLRTINRSTDTTNEQEEDLQMKNNNFIASPEALHVSKGARSSAVRMLRAMDETNTL